MLRELTTCEEADKYNGGGYPILAITFLLMVRFCPNDLENVQEKE